MIDPSSNVRNALSQAAAKALNAFLQLSSNSAHV